MNEQVKFCPWCLENQVQVSGSTDARCRIRSCPGHKWVSLEVWNAFPRPAPPAEAQGEIERYPSYDKIAHERDALLARIAQLERERSVLREWLDASSGTLATMTSEVATLRTSLEAERAQAIEECAVWCWDECQRDADAYGKLLKSEGETPTAMEAYWRSNALARACHLLRAIAERPAQEKTT